MERMKRFISICLTFALVLSLQPTVSVQAATQTYQFTISGPITAYGGDVSLQPLGNGMISIMTGDDIPGGNARCGLMNSSGKVIVSPSYRVIFPFKEGLALVGSGGKCGFINNQGKVIVPIIYDYADDFNGGVTAVRSGEKYGLVNSSGKVVLSVKYDKIGQYSDGLIAVVLDGKAGYVDKTGKVVIPMIYEDCDIFSEGLAAVCQGGKWGFIDKTGKVVVPFRYEQPYEFRDGMTSVYDIEADRTLQINTKGEDLAVVGLPEVYSRFEFVDTYFDGIALVSQGPKCGFADKNGNLITPLEYDGGANFADGMGLVIKDNKYGFVNTSGQLAVPIIYDEAYFFSEGYVPVTLGGKMGLVDKNGTVVIPIEYDYVSPVLGGIVALTKNNKSYIGVAPTTPAPIIPVVISAIPTSSKVLVNGTDISFDAYKINGNNYFKLRDLAKVLSGTNKQFEVTWDGTKNAINLISGQSYTVVGGELVSGDGQTKTPVLSTAKVYIDGTLVTLTAYTIGGNNYFKLRDVMQKFNVGVGWDGVTNTITVDTSLDYQP